MEVLKRKLQAMPNSYFGFVEGILSYARQKPERADRILQYIGGGEDLTPSDVVKFVMEQPDFHENGLSLKEIAS